MKHHACVGKITAISLCVLGAGLNAPAIAQDVDLFGVVKIREYIQDSSKVVRLNDRDSDEPLKFEAFVDPLPGGTVNSASVTPPGGSALELIPDESEFEFSAATDTPLDLEDDYPNGNYQMQIQTGGGPIAATLSLTGDAWPNIPQTTNFPAAQSINSAASFTLSWDSFATGTTDDIIEIDIWNEVTGNDILNSDSPGPGLDGTATSFTIPASTLSPGSRYFAEISFIKIVDVDTSSGPIGVAVYIAQTIVPIATIGLPTDSNPPWLDQSWPFWGESWVPVDSVVSFHFNEAMNPSAFPRITWSGAGLTPALFTYAWSNDGRRLSAIYSDMAGLPQDSEISWEINPATGTGTTVSDLAGNPLPQQTGNFHTASAPPSGDPDMDVLYLAKTQSLFQDASGLQPSDLFGFESIGDANTMGGVLSGILTIPGGGTVNLLDELDRDTFDVESTHTSKTDLDHFYPNGSYQVTLDTAHDGPKSATLNFPADSYPNDPTVIDVAALQTVDPEQPLTISWQPFAGATDTPEYQVMFWISTESGFDVFEADGDDGPGGLTGASTSIVIPAGTLSPGREYEAELAFAHVVDIDVTSYPGAVLATAFSKITVFEMQTIGTPIQPEARIVRSPGMTEIQVEGDRFTSYMLTASSDLEHWHQIQYPTNTWESGQVTIFDWDADFFETRYYQVVEAQDDEYYGPLPVSIHGTVYQEGSVNPIAGASVATSLDSNTATTDADGEFFLQTGFVRHSQDPYSIIITKPGYQSFNQNHDWGDHPRNQEFHLQPMP